MDGIEDHPARGPASARTSLFVPFCLVLAAATSAALAFSFYFRGPNGDYNLYYITIPEAHVNEYIPADASRTLAFPGLLGWIGLWGPVVVGGWVVVGGAIARSERLARRAALARSATAFAPLVLLLAVPGHYWLGLPMTIGPVFLMIACIAFCAVAVAYLLHPRCDGRVMAAVCSTRGALVLCLAYSILFSWLSLRQYYALHLGYVDSGLFVEGMAHAARDGALRTNWVDAADPEFTALWGDTGLCFSWHCFFLLSPLSYLYRLWPAHEMPLILQSVALGVAGVAVYLLANAVLHHRFAAWCLSVAWWIAPTTAFVNLPSSYGFRPESLIPASVLWGLYALERRRFGWFVLCLIVALLIKETVVPIVVMLGAFMAFGQRRWLVGALTALLGVGYYALATQVAIPYVFGRPYAFSPLLRQFGGSASEVVANVIGHPLDFIAGILGTKTKVFFLLHMVVPVLFLPVLSPTAALVGGASFAMLTMASYYSKHIIPFGQQVEILAGLYLAAVYGLRNACERPTAIHKWLLRSRALRDRARVLVSAGVGLLVAGALANGFFFVRSVEWRQFRPSRRARSVAELRQETSRTGSLCASYRLASHFTDQEELYVAPIGLLQADQVVLDLYDSFVPLATMAEYRARLLRSARYGLVYARDGFLIFRRGVGELGVGGQFKVTQGIRPRFAVGEPASEFATLLGYDAAESEGSVELTLLWRCERETSDDCAAVLLLRSDGERRAMRHLPTHGVLPTWAWRPGDVIRDRVSVPWTFGGSGDSPPLLSVRLEPLQAAGGRSAVRAGRP